MKTYKVKIIETLEKIVEVEAKDYYDALEKTDDLWNDGQWILDADNFTGVEFYLICEKEDN